MKARHKRLSFVLTGMVGLSIVAALILQAANSNMVFFYSPSQVQAGEVAQDHVFRLGGLVGEGSVKRGGGTDGMTVNFIVTDKAKTVPVKYVGMLPDMFQKGQGVVTQGRLNKDGVFVASEVLAKHDETYMSPEVADALEKAKKASRDPASDKLSPAEV